MDTVTKVLLSITSVALVATLVVNGPGTAAVIKSFFDGFSKSLGTAEKG